MRKLAIRVFRFLGGFRNWFRQKPKLSTTSAATSVPASQPVTVTVTPPPQSLPTSPMTAVTSQRMTLKVSNWSSIWLGVVLCSIWMTVCCLIVYLVIGYMSERYQSHQWLYVSSFLYIASLIWCGELLVSRLREGPLNHLATMTFLGKRLQRGGKSKTPYLFTEGPLWMPPFCEIQAYSLDVFTIPFDAHVPSRDMNDIHVIGALNGVLSDAMKWSSTDIVNGGILILKNRLEAIARRAVSYFMVIDINDMKGVIEEMVKGNYYLVARHAGGAGAVGITGSLLRNKANNPLVKKISSDIARDPIKLEEAQNQFHAMLEEMAKKQQLVGYDKDDSIEVIPSPEYGDTNLEEMFQSVGATLRDVEIKDVTPPKGVLEAAQKVVQEYYEGQAMVVESDNRVKRIKEIQTMLGDDKSLSAKDIWTHLLAEDKKLSGSVALFGDYAQFEKIFNSVGSTIGSAIAKGSK